MPERVVAGIGYAFRVTSSEIIRSAMQSHTVIRVIWLGGCSLARWLVEFPGCLRMLAITLLALTRIFGALLMRGNKRIREIQNHLTLLWVLLIRSQKLLVELPLRFLR